MTTPTSIFRQRRGKKKIIELIYRADGMIDALIINAEQIFTDKAEEGLQNEIELTLSMPKEGGEMHEAKVRFPLTFERYQSGELSLTPWTLRKINPSAKLEEFINEVVDATAAFDDGDEVEGLDDMYLELAGAFLNREIKVAKKEGTHFIDPRSFEHPDTDVATIVKKEKKVKRVTKVVKTIAARDFG